MGTKLQELAGGCFHKAMDDEEMFVLLARDEWAPDFVEAWARRRKEEIDAGKRPSSDLPQVEEAFSCAEKMRQWRIANDGAWRTGLFGQQA